MTMGGSTLPLLLLLCLGCFSTAEEYSAGVNDCLITETRLAYTPVWERIPFMGQELRFCWNFPPYCIRDVKQYKVVKKVELRNSSVIVNSCCKGYKYYPGSKPKGTEPVYPHCIPDCGEKCGSSGICVEPGVCDCGLVGKKQECFEGDDVTGNETVSTDDNSTTGIPNKREVPTPISEHPLDIEKLSDYIRVINSNYEYISEEPNKSEVVFNNAVSEENNELEIIKQMAVTLPTKSELEGERTIVSPDKRKVAGEFEKAAFFSIAGVSVLTSLFIVGIVLYIVKKRARAGSRGLPEDPNVLHTDDIGHHDGENKADSAGTLSSRLSLQPCHLDVEFGDDKKDCKVFDYSTME